MKIRFSNSLKDATTLPDQIKRIKESFYKACSTIIKKRILDLNKPTNQDSNLKQIK